MNEFDVFFRSLGRDEKGNDDPLCTVRVKANSNLTAISEARKVRSDIHYVVQVKQVI